MLLDNLDEYLSNPVLESLTEFDDEFDLEVGLESDSVDDLELTDEDIEAILDEDNEEFDDLDADFESAAYIEEEFDSALESVLYDSADEGFIKNFKQTRANNKALGNITIKDAVAKYVELRGKRAFITDMSKAKEIFERLSDKEVRTSPGAEGGVGMKFKLPRLNVQWVMISEVPVGIYEAETEEKSKVVFAMNTAKESLKTFSYKALRKAVAKQMTKNGSKLNSDTIEPTSESFTGGMEMFSDYDDYDYGYAMESDDFDDCDFEDDDFEEAEEGLFATKANKEAARGMDAKSLLELFVQKKGEGYFISDEELMKQQLESKGITEYNIVTVSDIIFAIVEDGAYYITKGRKVNKLKKSDMAKLQKAGARQLTKNERADNRQARRDARAAKKAAKRGGAPAEGEDDAEEGCASESWYDDYLYDYSDEY